MLSHPACSSENQLIPKKSEVFEGNVSELGALEKMLSQISDMANKPVIVADAGIGTQANIEWVIARGFDYLFVSRKRLRDIPAGINASNELEVLCHSSAKEIKETGIKTRFEKRFEAGLTDVQKAFLRKGGTEKYEKVLEKIGRLKERCRRVSRRYKIES